MTIDGIVGRSTWNKLQQIYKETVEDLPNQYKTLVEDVFPGRFLALGETGDDVKQIQKYLNIIAEKNPDIPKVEVSGVYDEATEAAVRAFQKDNEFEYESNGIVGPLTWSEIVTQGRGF